MYRVESVWTGLPGSPLYTRFHFLPVAGEETAEGADEAAGRVKAFWDAWAVYGVNDYTVQVQTEVFNINAANGQAVGVFEVSEAPTTGSSMADPVGRALQLLIRWNSGLFVQGRRVRGRTFIPGMQEGASDNVGRIQSTVVEAFETAASALAAEGTLTRLAVWSPTGGAALPVATATVWDEWAVLTSRRD